MRQAIRVLRAAHEVSGGFRDGSQRILTAYFVRGSHATETMGWLKSIKPKDASCVLERGNRISVRREGGDRNTRFTLLYRLSSRDPENPLQLTPATPIGIPKEPRTQ